MPYKLTYPNKGMTAHPAIFFNHFYIFSFSGLSAGEIILDPELSTQVLLLLFTGICAANTGCTCIFAFKLNEFGLGL